MLTLGIKTFTGQTGTEFAQYLFTHNLYHPSFTVESYQFLLARGFIKSELPPSNVVYTLDSEKFWTDFLIEMERLNLKVPL